MTMTTPVIERRLNTGKAKTTHHLTSPCFACDVAPWQPSQSPRAEFHHIPQTIQT
jgi:hypothetical protein